MAGLAERSAEAVPAKRDWRDTLSTLADLAMVGIVTTVVALPLVTAGGAVATASHAVHHRIDVGSLPPARETLRRLGRALLPGVGAGAVAAIVVGVLTANASGLAGGAVPGGKPLLIATAAIALLAIGLAGLTIVEVGRSGGSGWRSAVRRAWVASSRRPWLLAALGLVVLIALLIGLAIPACAPVLLGVLLYALHALAARTA